MEKPSFFTDNWKARIPREFIPTEGSGGAEFERALLHAGVKERRKSDAAVHLNRRSMKALASASLAGGGKGEKGEEKRGGARVEPVN